MSRLLKQLLMVLSAAAETSPDLGKHLCWRQREKQGLLLHPFCPLQQVCHPVALASSRVITV